MPPPSTPFLLAKSLLQLPYSKSPIHRTSCCCWCQSLGNLQNALLTPEKMWAWKRMKLSLECPAADVAFVWWMPCLFGVLCKVIVCHPLKPTPPPQLGQHSISLSLHRWQETRVEVSCWGFWHGLSLEECTGRNQTSMFNIVLVDRCHLRKLGIWKFLFQISYFTSQW